MPVHLAQQDRFWDIKAAIARAIVNSSEPSLARLEEEIFEEFGQAPDKRLTEYYSELLAAKQKLEQEKNFWDIKTSIARSIVNRKAPTLAALEEEILEEFGHQPEPELISYFNQLMEDRKLRAREKEFRSIKRSIARSIAASPSPTLDRLQEEILDEFGHMPDQELVSYFKELLAEREKADASKRKDIHQQFADEIARGPRPTVLSFREAFNRKFGESPSEELTRYFLGAIRGNMRNIRQRKEESPVDQAKIEFTRTVANGLVKTVLQFHKAFERAFDEPPQAELIEFFIKNLAKNKRAMNG